VLEEQDLHDMGSANARPRDHRKCRAYVLLLRLRGISGLDLRSANSGEENTSFFGEGCVLRGSVKWFNNSKGYGFIGRDDGPDVFVHYSAVVGDGYRTLQKGDLVEFEIVQGPKAPQAANVQKVDGRT
jgi:CspA family cold shock protein